MMGSAERWLRAALGTATVLCGLGGPLVAQDGDTWQPLDPLPTPRRLLAAAAEGGKVYTFGGCGSPCFGPPAHTSTIEETRVEVFDPATGRWTGGRAPIPAIFFGGAAAAPGNGRIYLAGGFLTGDQTLEYTPASDAWRSVASMPTARHGLAAVALGGKVYAVGGSDGRTASDALEVYDPTSDSWRRGPPMPTPRVYLAAAALDGKLYAVGGSPDCCGKAATAAVEVYDPATDRWSRTAPLPVALQVSAAASDGRRLYVFGGLVPGEGVRNETFEHDPATGAWRTRTPLPVGRDQAPAVVVGDCAFVPGGSVDCHCQALAAAHKYTFDLPPPPAAVEVDLAIDLSDGREAVMSGDEVTYTLRVTNAGPEPATDALVRDAFPPRFVDVTWTCTATGEARCFNAEGRGKVRELVSIPPEAGAAATFEVTGTVAPAVECPTPRTLTHRATVEPGDGAVDTDLRNNSATDRDGVRVVSELTVSQRPVPLDVGSGDPLAFEITVTNRGPDAACGARVVDTPPDRLDGPSLSEELADLDVEIDVPAGGEGVSLELQGTVAPTALSTCPYLRELENRVRVVAPPGTTDDPANNDSTATARLLPRPQPTLTKTDRRGAVACGGEVTYSIVLTNESTTDALCESSVVDAFPDGLAGVAWTCSGTGDATCGPGGGAPLEDDVTVPPGETVTYTATGTAAGDLGEAVCNQATLTADLDGDGFPDVVSASDDPEVPGGEDPTCFEVCPPALFPIPALSPLVLLLLAALLASLGALLLRRG